MNATLMETFDVEEGDYSKVFVHVSEVDGTLTDGSSADVKLPSEKLQLNEEFTVEANSTVDFVYDITVVERGNTDKYNIKPVASESGTDVPIERVDGETNDSDDAPEVAAEFVGNVTAGENATVSVTSGDEPVEGTTVTYDGTDYTTSADGEVTFAVPEDAEAVEVTVEYEDTETEIETDASAASTSGNASYGSAVLA